ncbi:MAG: FecR domain-containing protein [Cyclobacteriaceae bacterium]
MKEEKFIDLFVRKMAGTLSADEAIEFENNKAEHSELHQELQKQWEVSGQLHLSHKPNVKQSWEAFESQMEKPAAKTIRLWPTILRVAAVAIFTIGLAFYFLNEGEEVLYATKSGETKEIVLPDGSKILLNASSQISLTSDFNHDTRELSLKGEAFFDVNRDEERPFIIYTGEATTKVLGTSFNIKALPESDNILLSVASGKVSFTSDDQQLILTKNMSASFNKNSEKMKQILHDQNSTFWKTKKLVFDDERISDVIKSLETHFKVKIKLQTAAIGKCRFTGSFEDSKVENILDIISISLKLKYEKRNNSYILNGAGCAE